ncbi:hypothetical protein D3C72_1902520 [compost metagenome]
MIWDEHLIPTASFEPSYQRRISGVAPCDFRLSAIFLLVHRLLHAASDPRIHGHNGGGGEFAMAVHRNFLRYARRSSHVCLAQFPGGTPALCRLGLWVHQR